MRLRFVRTPIVTALVAALAGTACGSDVTDLPPAPPGLDDPGALGASGLRRLTRAEVVASLAAASGLAVDDLAGLLPEDIAGQSPFDNNYEAQTVSPLLISAYAGFAQAFATRFAGADVAGALGGCTPTGADDAACLRAVAERFGRRMFRRPLTTSELDTYLAAIAPESATANDFAVGLEMLALLFAQHPEFLYRVEREAGDLDSYEIATRLSYLLWGSGPDDALLDVAAGDGLSDANTRLREAERMLDDPRAKTAMQRFHAQWLGYSVAALPGALADDLRAETDRLVERVIFETDSDWLSVFTWPESYVTPALATHYGLPAVAGEGWTSYPAGRAGGVLTHGTFLTIGAKFGDTSPTVRGAEIYHRLTCGSLGTIPGDVDTDLPPGNPTDCKPARYAFGQSPACIGCHGQIDTIGFGLENFGVSGGYRTTEPGNPACVIDGAGAWNGTPYHGPEELGRLIVEDPRVTACATKQLFRFAVGRNEQSADATTLAAMAAVYDQSPSLRGLLLTLVRSPAFAYRKGA